MSTSNESDAVLNLLDSGKIIWPESVSDRNKFIIERFCKVWDALLGININANIAVFSNLDKIDKLTKIDYVSYDEDNSTQAWAALCEVLMLIVILEDALGIDITFQPKYGEQNDFAIEKAKIRSRISPQ